VAACSAACAVRPVAYLYDRIKLSDEVVTYDIKGV
jgi:hypothetical protein